MKEPFEWSHDWHERFREICSRRWGFRYKHDDPFTLRDVVERSYQASNCEDLSTFARRLEALGDTDPQVQAFIGLMVVSETSFFRNRAQFDALETSILPDLVAERRSTGPKRLRFWSAGCSSGEEPYSLAILVTRVVPDWRSWDIKIFATDINPFALRRAHEALYTDWSFREMDPRLVDEYFTKASRLYRFDHPCRSLVSFFRQNLATDEVPDPNSGLAELDMVLCRNVSIYFNRDLTDRLARGFFDALKPGGWLLVGHAEPDISTYQMFEQVDFPDTIVYRRPLTARRAETGAALSAPSVSPPEQVPSRRPAQVPQLSEAVAAYDAGQTESAYELLVHISQREADNPLPPHRLAQISADKKHYDEARYWAFTALQRDPFHVPSLLLMGIIALEMGEPLLAKAQFKKALFVEPECPEAHLYLSMALSALDDNEQAARSRDRAVRHARRTHSVTDEPLLPIQRPRLALSSEPLAGPTLD